MKNLENFGAQEMNAKEIKETEGDIHWFWPDADGAAVFAIICDWKHFKAGLFGRPSIN
jgi:hypothetical protein|tara:strand:+ start:1070 stop:1243 length:174 start_codon:yes stop_codon:yes gene_type:complete